MLGSDPEFFFKRGDKIIPSREVIAVDDENIHRDGVQGEATPIASSCRQSCVFWIARCLEKAHNQAKQAGAEVSFTMGAEVPVDSWKSVPQEDRRFGCVPSENIYGTKRINVTGQKIRFRACGGHIHYGSQYAVSVSKDSKKLEELVKMMDLFAGNTMVLLDRDPSNIRRRKYYGRAGEYRIKKYGIEYRTLSNFWLRHPVLWSLASAQVRNAVAAHKCGELRKALLKEVDFRKVKRAINNNDFNLALENYDNMIRVLKRLEVTTTGGGISYLRADKFREWVTSPNPLKKLGSLTDEASIERWMGAMNQIPKGFEHFIGNLK